MPPRISVIICTRNRFADLKETIASLGRQTRMPDELIVVDSSDTQVIREYLDSSGIPLSFQYVHTSPGLTYQRNIGIEKSQGGVTFFFDDDVDLATDYIELVEKVFLQDASCRIGAVGGRIPTLEQPAQKTIFHRLKTAYFKTLRSVFLQSDFGDGKFRYSGMPTHPHLIGVSRYMECLSGCCMAFRREVFNTIRFDEKLTRYAVLEDADISKQVIDIGYKIYYEASAIVVHKESPVSRLKEAELAEMMVLNYAYLFQKHCPQTWFRKIAFYWTLFGLLTIYLHSSPGRQGVWKGIRQLMKGESLRP